MHKQSGNKRNSSSTFLYKGFTLIELLLVIAIIGFLSTFGISISKKYNQNQQLSTAVQDVRSTLYSARSQAQSVVSTQCAGSPFTGIVVRFCNSNDLTNTACTSTQCHNNGDPDYEMDVQCGGSYKATLQTKSLPSGSLAINPDICAITFQPFTSTFTQDINVAITGFSKTTNVVVKTNGAIQ